MTPLPRDWSAYCVEPALTDGERQQIEHLYQVMDWQFHLAACVDRATRAEQDAFNATCDRDLSAAAVARRQDALRRYLRAQLAAGQEWLRAHDQQTRALRTSVAVGRASSAQMVMTL